MAERKRGRMWWSAKQKMYKNQLLGRFAATPHQSQPGSEEPVCDSFSSRRSLCSSVKQLYKLKFAEKNLRQKTRLLRNAAGGYFIALWTE